MHYFKGCFYCFCPSHLLTQGLKNIKNTFNRVQAHNKNTKLDPCNKHSTKLNAESSKMQMCGNELISGLVVCVGNFLGKDEFHNKKITGLYVFLLKGKKKRRMTRFTIVFFHKCLPSGKKGTHWMRLAASD